MRGSEAPRPRRIDFDLESLSEVLTFVEQYVSVNSSVRPTINEEFELMAPMLPTRIHAEIRLATRWLLTEPEKPIGKVVVVTGLSKAGKETQMTNPSGLKGVTSVSDWLQKRNYKVSTTRTSFDTVAGGLIACFLGRPHETLASSGTLNRDLAWILWSLERAQRSARAAAWLSNDERNVLVAKRWTESNLAYHSVWGVDASRILGLERNILKPDYILNLDASLESVRRRGEVFQVWSEEETRSIGKSLRDVQSTYPFGALHSVDGNGSPSQVNGRLLDALDGLFS